MFNLITVSYSVHHSCSGMSCVAPFVDNDVNQYYRAKVLSINRNDAEVMFVDYGNEATVPIGELKYLPKVIVTSPCDCLLHSFHF